MRIYFAPDIDSREPRQCPGFAVDWNVAHLPRGPVRESQRSHFFFGPECSIHHQTVATFYKAIDFIVDLRQAGNIGKAFSFLRFNFNSYHIPTPSAPIGITGRLFTAELERRN